MSDDDDKPPQFYHRRREQADPRSSIPITSTNLRYSTYHQRLLLSNYSAVDVGLLCVPNAASWFQARSKCCLALACLCVISQEHASSRGRFNSDLRGERDLDITIMMTHDAPLEQQETMTAMSRRDTPRTHPSRPLSS